ncbi:MAG: histidine phosphatase family protein [Nocardioidaceae bacterium]
MNHPVYLVRHGQSEWNVLRRTQGQTAHPRLTELGREQADAAATLIATDLRQLGLAPQGIELGIEPDPESCRILSSDLTRAVETARILRMRLGGTLTLDERLREQHLGSLQGRDYDETWAIAEQLDWSDPTQLIAGGESRPRLRADGRGSRPGRPGGGHRAGIARRRSCPLAHLSGLKPNEAEWVAVPNGAVARIVDGVSWLE